MAYTGTIRNAFFEEGKFSTQLTIEVRLDNPEDHPHIPDGVVKNWFGTGKGWTVNGNGAVAYTGDPRKDGTVPTTFNGNTAAGRLCTQMRVVDPEAKTLANGTPLQADFWKALGHVRWGPVNVPKREQQPDGSYKDVPGGKDVSMPVELLDDAGTAAAEFDPASLGLMDSDLAALTSLAHGASDSSAFISAVVTSGLPGEVKTRVAGSDGAQIWESLRLL